MTDRAQPAQFILGIETSCDETAVAITSGQHEVLANIVASQHDLHRTYAGVVPEIASRAHLERLIPVMREALRTAGVTFSDLAGVAVGHRPGLIGSLLVGVSAAKATAWALQKPIIGVDHILAHLHACELDSARASYPALGLVVSGGHTAIFRISQPGEAVIVGHTIDDAVGEAYDKVATMLGFPYPGGPQLDRLAQTGDPSRFALPVARLSKDSLAFSFSGLKTAMLYAIRGHPRGRGADVTYERTAEMLNEVDRADMAASFQRAAVDAIMLKVELALDRFSVNTLLVGGGVSANSHLRERLANLAQRTSVDVRLPRMEYCIDNAAMIAGLGAVMLQRNCTSNLTLRAEPATGVVLEELGVT